MGMGGIIFDIVRNDSREISWLANLLQSIN